MIECLFFRHNPNTVGDIDSFAAISEADYVEIIQCPSVGSLRELAGLLGVDESGSFGIVLELPGAAVFRAGREFEGALVARTVDELNDAAARWAHAASWRDWEINTMDSIGIVMSLAAHWAAASRSQDGLFTWVDRGA